MKKENKTGPDTSKKKLKLKYPVEKNAGFVFTSYFIEKIPIFVSCKSSLYRNAATTSHQADH